MFTLNNVQTKKEYDAEVTLEGTAGKQVNFQISNAAVFYQLKVKTEPQVPESGWDWSDEVFSAPTFQSLRRNVIGIRFRSANEEEPAQVTAQILTALDLGG